jgi:hypothetical protein
MTCSVFSRRFHQPWLDVLALHDPLFRDGRERSGAGNLIEMACFTAASWSCRSSPPTPCTDRPSCCRLCDRLFELPYGNGMPSIGCGEACDLVFRQA